ncbi:MAG: universal stress protein [Halovenus sp.]
MFKVLLAVDADEARALAGAEATISLPDAAQTVQATVLNVQKDIELTSGEGGSVDSDQWYDEGEFPSSAKKARERLEDAGVAVEMRREHADPAEAIIEVADEIDADRIVISGRKRSPVGKVLFGSVTQSVLLASDVPVTVAMV